MQKHAGYFAARGFFDRAGTNDPSIKDYIHPEARFDLEAAEQRIAALAYPGMSTTPKSTATDPDAVAFDLLEGVEEAEYVDDTFKSPAHIVTKFSASESVWKVWDFISTPRG